MILITKAIWHYICLRKSIYAFLGLTLPVVAKLARMQGTKSHTILSENSSKQVIQYLLHISLAAEMQMFNVSFNICLHYKNALFLKLMIKFFKKSGRRDDFLILI